MDTRLLAERVRTARGELSLREFAKRCGVSHTHLDSIEKGVDPRTGKSVTVSVDTLEKLASGIGCSIAYLMGDSIGDRIKDRRISLGLTLEETAQRTGIQESSLKEFESGEIEYVQIDIIKALADTLGTSSEYLFGHTDNPDEIFTRDPMPIYVGGRYITSTDVPESAISDLLRKDALDVIVPIIEKLCSIDMVTPSGAKISVIWNEYVKIVADFIERNSDLLKTQFNSIREKEKTSDLNQDD